MLKLLCYLEQVCLWKIYILQYFQIAISNKSYQIVTNCEAPQDFESRAFSVKNAGNSE